MLHIVFTDSYTTNDIIFEWSATDVNVGTKQMAQFEYEGVQLSSATDVFSTGKMLLCVLDYLNCKAFVLQTLHASGQLAENRF